MPPLTTDEVAATQSRSSANAPSPSGLFLVCLPSMASDALHSMLDTLARAFHGSSVLIATPDYEAEDSPTADGTLRIIPYATPRADLGWVLAARDFVTASQLAVERNAQSVILLDAEAASLSAEAFLHCAELLRSGTDLALPLYSLDAHQGLVTSTLLYPVTRALFGTPARFPLAPDIGMSQRMAQRMAVLGQRQNTAGQPDALVWPAAEAASANFRIAEFSAGQRALPQPAVSDFNTLFTGVAGSLFSDVEAKATFWQRARVVSASSPSPSLGISGTTPSAEVADLIAQYRLAFRNLGEVWSLVLPPQSMLALKKLSLSSPEDFHFPANLWARIAYDFALAFHARTLNRGHLLGAFTPLYLACVASLLRASGEDTRRAETQIEETATAFEREKPYLVARWRWPDRFNP